jgi:signal peptidase
MKTLKRITNTAGTIVVVLVVLLAVLLVGVRLLGLNAFAVLSGSMEPTYHVGSLIYVKSVSAEDIKVGDPITFVLDENLTVATHRVVSIETGEDGALRFETKGDANETVDGNKVHEANLIGKPVFTIPYLGYVANFIQHPPGTYIAISVGAILLLLFFLPELFGVFKEEDKKESSGRVADKE